MLTKNIGRLALGAVLAAVALSSGRAQAAESKFAAGQSWVNEDGSVLAITALGANGQLTGTMTSQVGCGAPRKRNP